jgi:hypothetical protein
MGYKESKAKHRDCLYSIYITPHGKVDKNCDSAVMTFTHDGTNHYLYRVYKDNVRNLKMTASKKLYDGTATTATMFRITRSTVITSQSVRMDIPTHQESD